MTTLASLRSPVGLARSAGALYLLIAVAGGFAIGYLPTVLTVPGDAVATAEAINAHLGLARLGLGAEVVVMLAEIGLTALLFRLLSPVSELAARTAAWARLAMVMIMGVNIMLSAGAIALIDGATVPGAVADAASQMLALRDIGVKLWGFFFALHLALLGGLVFAAPYLPKLFGVLIGLGSLGYLLDSASALLVPGNEPVAFSAAVFLAVSMLGEIGFTFYLLIRGLNARAFPAATA